MFYFFPAGDYSVEEFIKLRTVVMVLQVTQFMGNNIINTFLGCFHQLRIERYHTLADRLPHRFRIRLITMAGFGNATP